MTYTQEHLTNLLTTDREKLTRICAEVCYGWREEDVGWPFINTDGAPDWDTIPQLIDIDGKIVMPSSDFQPLANTEKGRSQAFELAVKFDCFPYKSSNTYVVDIFEFEADSFVEHENPQSAIVIASILTAQQENNDE